MKILFSKKMAFVYGGLSVCAVIGFIVTMNRVVYFRGLLLFPIDLMPVTHIVQPLFFAGIIFGGLAVLCRWGINKSTVSIIFAVGILLTGTFKVYWIIATAQVYSRDNPRQLTDVVIYSGKVRNYDLGHGVVIAQTLCTSVPFLLVDVYEGTKIYEQDGASQQKRQVELDALQPGQVVDIDGMLWLQDPELMEFLFAKYDPRFLNEDYLIGATEITIHKGESAPMNDKACYDGFMSEP